LKVSPGGTAGFCRAPDLALIGVLLHGADEGFVASCRRELVSGILGPDPDPLRLTRMDAAAVRRDPAALDSALRARGFFAGRGVVLVEGATEGVAGALDQVLAQVTADDAFLVVTAGSLPDRSGLRRLFDQGRLLASLPVVAEPPTVEEIEARLAELGLRSGLDEDARAQLGALALALDRACFDRVLESVAIYSLGADRPLRAEEVALLGPGGLDAEMDAFVDAVAGGRVESVGPTLRRVVAAGASAVTLLLGLQRHFRQMLIAEGASGRAPLWGARRETIRAQVRRWRRDRLDLATRMLYETDARVRSAERVPALALVERCALRLAMMASDRAVG
jgi:DNA polymerase III subunit delta